MNQVNESHSRASDIWREVASLFRPPSRLPVAEAIRRYMRVPRGANTSGPWESSLTPYMIDPINTLSAVNMTRWCLWDRRGPGKQKAD